MEICDGKKQQSNKPSRSPSPERAGATSPAGSASYRPIARTPPPARVGPPPSPPVPTNPIAPVAPEPSGPVHLTPCLVCGRTFVPQSLDKHVKICEKMLSKKRKTFDSSRQRREGTDLEQFLPKNFGLPENSPFLEKSPPNTAKTLPKTKPSVKRAIQKPTADLERCPHCGRAFGPRAFERHVEWCGDKAKILPPAPAAAAAGAVADAKQRLNARTQYRAPLTRGRRSSQTRDKSSNSRSASVESRGSPPRVENGEYRRGRTRASESVSSNDYHEETTPHVPVIRQAGARTNNSGDSHVRARQARLARDLSSTRVEDSYDPFLSAARQMKELMSSETNIPQKFNSTKDHNRTLPILRPNKDKNLLTNNRQDNSKTMKDSINRTYKKIPTLHRMKSFGSTNNDNNNTSTPFGARCSSFRINRNNKSSSQSLNTTFTKSSKENISSLSSSFNRNGLMNRSFSSYNNSTYSTPKPRDKIPKISTSMSHSFQRTTIKQPTKLEKAKQNDDKKEFVNLDTILVQDNLSMTDSNYIDPRLINENDNLPINVNTIRNNPDIISSMESLLTTENLPAKFDSFANVKNNNVETVNAVNKTLDNATNNNSNDKTSAAPTMDDLTTQYDKIMSSLEQSIASKTSIRDDDSLCEDFDLEEFMTNFDDDIKQKTRICSSTTRIIKQSELVDDNRTSEQNSICSTPKIVHSSSNGSIPFNKSMSLNFSSNSIAGDSLFPSSAKRSTSLLDSIQKKNSAKSESIKSRHNADQLEQDIMKSLKDFGRFYENESQPHKEIATYNATVVNGNGTARRDFRAKSEKKNKIQSDDHNGYTPNGKSSNDSAYSSLNRISPSKLSVCNSKELNGMDLDRIPAGSDSSDSQRDGGLRSVSSDEFLAMERSAEHEGAKAHDNNPAFGRLTSNDHGKGNREEKRTSSRASHTGTTRRARGSLSSSGSESSVPAAAAAAGGGHRLSRFCHECGNRFPVHTAKFCIECGCKRLVV